MHEIPVYELILNKLKLLGFSHGFRVPNVRIFTQVKVYPLERSVQAKYWYIGVRIKIQVQIEDVKASLFIKKT